MQRYKNYADIINDDSGKRRYSTIYYPQIPRKTTDVYKVATRGDRLDLLAYEYYGDARLWVILAKANNLLLPTLRIKPGTRIRIPFPLDVGGLNELFNSI